MFLPTTQEEMHQRGWEQLDVILITSDAYIDSPYMGVSVVGRILEKAGYTVGIIAQPDVTCKEDISRLGEPKLFWGVSGGSVDSMVSNYTATKKFRNSDDYTPGGINNKRPDRASLVYTNLIRQCFKETAPIMLGGIEASLRRVTHYDFWSNKLRKPILFDAKADYLLYGMSDKSILEFANALQNGEKPLHVKGLSYLSKEPKESYIALPSHDECVADKLKFMDMFDLFYHNNDPLSAKGLCQKVDTRYLIQNPPALYLTTEEMDEVSALPFMRDAHPYYKKMGAIKALETIKFSISTHQGCYGECNFCAISVHQGRTIRSRSTASIVNEAKHFATYKDFKGIISDLGGPTANMYGYECEKKLSKGSCETKSCMFPKICKALKPTHKKQLDLLRQIRALPHIKKAFVASGIRYDLISEDKAYGYTYLKEIIEHHTSGQMKIAPEHIDDEILSLMGKPGKNALVEFKALFDKLSKESGKKQFLTYYLIAAHPGCDERHMHSLKQFASQVLKINPEQAQVFTPTPSTYSTLMYYTGLHYKTRQPLFVEKEMHKKEKQKAIVIAKESSFKSNFSS
ncbi:YgiQ family radical SAM protein [Sulfurospirillum barnesii]|uniref:Putative radical SAM protein YgiQ n=1 Tax=Sulfurospirillum barnesii (strain ATCC 700032 / DSM 10660 / SES-3) TaxID=760154 RepID=I3XWW3_SULBS|nr:YgiQ family radical SAM protein [Sulfurospirillum barnesii]AFL68437.1 putative radical SAM protein YgiQ [Sulfurospirillum barnesii SES-3]